MLNYRNLLLELMQYDYKLDCAIKAEDIPIPSATSGERIKSMIVLCREAVHSDSRLYVTAIKELGETKIETVPYFFYSMRIENTPNGIDDVVAELGTKKIQVRGIVRL